MQIEKDLKPSLWIGKEGLKKEQIENIKKHLKRHSYIKVKLQKSVKDQIQNVIDQILKQTNTKLVKKIGFTFTLKEKRE